MLDSVGSPVVKLLRVQVGLLYLGDLPKGSARDLTIREVMSLMELANEVKDK